MPVKLGMDAKLYYTAGGQDAAGARQASRGQRPNMSGTL